MSVNSTVSIDKDLLEEFITEAQHLTESFDLAMLELEKHKDDELITEQLRILHTLKGNAATVGAIEMERCAHELETLLIEEQKIQADISPTIMEQLFNGSDLLQRLLLEYERGKSVSKKESALQQYIVHIYFSDKTVDKELETLQVLALLRSVGTIKKIDPDTSTINKSSDHCNIYLESTFDLLFLQQHVDILDTNYTLQVEQESKLSPKRKEFLPNYGEVANIDSLISQISTIDSTLHIHISQLHEHSTSLQEYYNMLFEKVSTMQMSSENQKISHLYIREMLDLMRSLYQQQQEFLVRNQYSMMDIMADIQRTMIILVKSRMIPMHSIFIRFKRLVRDTAMKLGKKVGLEYRGEKITIDREISERIFDILTHCIRNALDHGIEDPGDRKIAGKQETGMISIVAEGDGDSVKIIVSDDGRGIDTEKIKKHAAAKGLIGKQQYQDEELYQFLFLPGFSTAETLTTLSGRGIGLDIVQSTIHSLRGKVYLSSKKGKGTTMTMQFPVTLALMSGVLVRSQSNEYIFPVKNVRKSYRSSDVVRSMNYSSSIAIQNTTLSYTTLEELLGKTESEEKLRPYFLYVDFDDYCGLIGVDAVLGNDFFSITPFCGFHTNGIRGACIAGTSHIALLVNL